MIQELQIRNFKSIKELKIPCKKLNVFIGEPNSGNSNIIEALALQSQNVIGQELNSDIFRYKTIGELFFDFDINTPIEVFTSEMQTSLSYTIRDNKVPENQFSFILDKKNTQDKAIKIQHDGKVTDPGSLVNTNVHF